MAAKLTRLTHKLAIKLHLVADSCTISHSRRPVRKLSDTPLHSSIWIICLLFHVILSQMIHCNQTKTDCSNVTCDAASSPYRNAALDVKSNVTSFLIGWGAYEMLKIFGLNHDNLL